MVGLERGTRSAVLLSRSSFWTMLFATVLFATVLSLAAGCGGAMTVRGEIVQPAQVPVRAFPRILVVASAEEESQALARTVASHLAGGRSSVDRADRERVSTMRDRGEIERATVVLELAASLSVSGRPEWQRREGFECGPMGCIEARGSRIEEVPLVRGHVVVTVSDGPSGRSLQHVELSEEESGADVLGARLRVVTRLAERTLALVDQRVENVSVDLYPVARGEVLEALATLREGHWPEGRRLLEAFVRSERFHALTRAERAVVLYDLGQARRFDATSSPEQRFENAGRALRAAVRLDPQPRFAQALAALEEHRQARAMVREQQEAMAHNFALSGADDAAHGPDPAALYRD